MYVYAVQSTLCTDLMDRKRRRTVRLGLDTNAVWVDAGQKIRRHARSSYLWLGRWTRVRGNPRTGKLHGFESSNIK